MFPLRGYLRMEVKMTAPSFLTWRLVARVRRPPHTVMLPFQASRRGISSRLFARSHNLLQRRRKESSFTPSHEQLEVVKLCRVQNVVVSARPGSGKTATAEAIVAAYPDKRVAVLTYSKRLQLETSHRLHSYSNCDVFTFHAIAGFLFRTIVRNDAELLEQKKRVCRCEELPQWNCTDILFWLTNCFILSNKQKKGGQSPKLVLLGDERQSIYSFRGANPRYLSLASELLGPISPYQFFKISLSQSFRLSHWSAQFINKVFLGGESYITSSKPGPKPIVLRCNPYKTYALAKALLALIKQHGASNVAIIASIRNNRPLQLLTNLLAERFKIPIEVPTNEDSPLDDRVTHGKICVSTVHQFKGRERHLVILLGIDTSFFDYFGRDIPDDKCPNEVFVALTRAAKQLVLVHDERKKLIPFVSVKALYDTAEVINITNGLKEIAPPDAPGRPLKLGLSLPSCISVRDMTRHIRDESLHDIITRNINIPDVVCSDPVKGFFEAVSDINGLVIAAAFEHSISGTLNTLNLDQSTLDVIPPICSPQYVSWLCRHACTYEAGLSGYLPRSIQMKNHALDWIKPRDIALARNRLQGELGALAANLEFEVKAEQTFSVGEQKTRIQGQADIVSTSNIDCRGNAKSIWEIKFVSQLSDSHVIQACTYAYLLGTTSIMKDEEFIKMCAKTRLELLSLESLSP
ncbi:P-loop containing nucleoside triphosphate hydrolase protein [Trichoderma barbatum]